MAVFLYHFILSPNRYFYACFASFQKNKNEKDNTSNKRQHNKRWNANEINARKRERESKRFSQPGHSEEIGVEIFLYRNSFFAAQNYVNIRIFFKSDAKGKHFPNSLHNNTFILLSVDILNCLAREEQGVRSCTHDSVENAHTQTIEREIFTHHRRAYVWIHMPAVILRAHRFHGTTFRGRTKI